MQQTKTLTIKDRNNAAYLLANGFTCDFVPRPDGGLDAEFQWTPDLDIACRDYMSNRGVPVQSFVAACKFIGDRIRDHRNKGGRL
jgi:hypothetical protein